MQACAACHGWQGPNGYVFEGAKIGQVEPNKDLGADPNRLDSYTQKFRDWQVSTMFEGTPYHFSHFAKTDGYANLPLDGLWLRAPYLHNGSVPTLADLLTAARPAAEGFRARLGRDRSGQGRVSSRPPARRASRREQLLLRHQPSAATAPRATPTEPICRTARSRTSWPIC